MGTLGTIPLKLQSCCICSPKHYSENTFFIWKTKLQSDLIWRIHLFCEWKASLQHGLKGLLNKKAVMSCWNNASFVIVAFNQEREDMNQKAQVPLTLQDHQREDLPGKWPVMKPALSYFKVQCSDNLTAELMRWERWLLILNYKVKTLIEFGASQSTSKCQQIKQNCGLKYYVRLGVIALLCYCVY